MADPDNNTRWLSPGTLWNGMQVLCQDFIHPLTRGIWSDSHYFGQSYKTIMSVQLSVILVATTTACIILRPLRLPFLSQVIAGVGVGLLFKEFDSRMVFSPTANYILRTFSFLGFYLHAFMLGVETSTNAVRKIGKKSFFIAFAGMFTSLGLAHLAHSSVRHLIVFNQGPTMLSMFNFSTFVMVTCSHLNDLGMSNSDLGRLAASVTLVLDITGMVVSFSMTNLVIPLLQKRLAFRPLLVCVYYLTVFFVFRPVVKYIVSLTPEGRPMKQTHFLLIISVVLFMGFVGELVDERFGIFLFAFSLPEEPLGTVLTERLEAINSSVFFPIFCAVHGMKANVYSLGKRSYIPEVILLGGYVGKFFGIFIAAMISGLVLSHALALSLIMSSKGLMDIAIIGLWRDRTILLSEEEYTVALFHIIIFTGLFLPLTRYLYNPSRQYSSVLRRSVIENCENGSFHTLVCIHTEESIPGIIHLLEMSYPTRSNPLSVVGLQLMNQTGRASLPFMAPLDQVASSAAFRSNLARCNRIVNTFLHFQRENKGNTLIQHYIAVTPYATMHNDICKLAYDKNTNLIIIPFHIRWTSDGTVEDTSLTIRDINVRTLEKAPCSVGLLIDRGIGSRARPQPEFDVGENMYRVAVLFAGGTDDHETLAYSCLMARHPNVQLVVVWLKGGQDDEFKGLDYDVMRQFRQKCYDNDRVSFKEVAVNDGSDTTKVVVSLKDDVDLMLVGKHHEPKCPAVFGLNDGWMEHPELGIMGDVLASPEFRFSILVVQQEPRADSDIDIFEYM